MSTTANNTGPERLALRADEAATLLGISTRHFHALNASARLPTPVRLGRSVRWRRDELLRWLNAGCPPRERWEVMKEREK